MSVSPIPEGFHTITPYLVLENVPEFLKFVTQAFDAVELERVTMPDGTIMHAEVRIGSSPLMMGSVKQGWDAIPGFLHLYLPDADATYARAIEAGATSMQEPKDEFYGDRTCGVKDGFGNLWWFATRQENLSSDEIQKRAAHAMKAGG